MYGFELLGGGGGLQPPEPPLDPPLSVSQQWQDLEAHNYLVEAVWSTSPRERGSVDYSY